MPRTSQKNDAKVNASLGSIGLTKRNQKVNLEKLTQNIKLNFAG
jgi:hypothetical protein